MRIIDLSVSLSDQPDRSSPRIEYVDHHQAAVARAEQIGIDPSGFPVPGIHFASERISSVVHGSGTHVDAPWHYGPRTAGARSRTVDQLPLEWFYGDAVVLDFSMVQDGGVLTPADISRALGDHVLSPGEIVLIRTDLDALGQEEQLGRLKELGRDALGLLLDRGVHVIGVDAISPDRPNTDALRNGDRSAYFPAHHLGREREFCFVEYLTNLRVLPHDGFSVALFPVKISHGSGGWCRAVAFVEDAQ